MSTFFGPNLHDFTITQKKTADYVAPQTESVPVHPYHCILRLDEVVGFASSIQNIDTDILAFRRVQVKKAQIYRGSLWAMTSLRKAITPPVRHAK